jgi:hypothetical protein
MVNEEAIGQYLEKFGCPNIDTVMSTLKPFFKIAKTGRYPLQPFKKVDQEGLKRAFNSAYGRPFVNKVVEISASRPDFRKPDWMAGFLYEAAISESIADSDSHLHFDRDQTQADFINFDRACTNLWSILRENLWKDLWSPASASLKASAWGNILDNGFPRTGSLSCIVGNGLFDALHFYLCFCLLKQMKAADRVAPVLEFWSKFLILGRKLDDSKTLLILCR